MNNSVIGSLAFSRFLQIFFFRYCSFFFLLLLLFTLCRSHDTVEYIRSVFYNIFCFRGRKMLDFLYLHICYSVRWELCKWLLVILNYKRKREKNPKIDQSPCITRRQWWNDLQKFRLRRIILSMKDTKENETHL